MGRSLIALLLIAWLAVLAAPAAAQVGSKAYAPEDLGRLSVPDRIRVLEREYGEQSRGRQLPNDQLEFYLDQIDSGWTFSRIKQDIAESLRGSSWSPPTPGWQARELVCSSDNGRYRECRTPFRGPAVLSQQISRAVCVEGHSWGQRRGVLWVDHGCRGRFSEDRRWNDGGYGPGPRESIVCESREGRLRRCANGFRGDTELSEQYSNAPCIRGQSWDARPGEVWVSRGCRARFVEARGRARFPDRHDDRYSVTCGSDDGRRRTCGWTDRQRPRLIEQLSRARCVEGQTWGYQAGVIWVDLGCRARFGTR